MDSQEYFNGLVEEELKDIFSDRQMPLYKMMSYHLGWEDQYGNPITAMKNRPFGTACLIACQSSGCDPNAALPAAASVELANSSCEVHDDFQVGRMNRNGQDSIWWVWGPAQGINAGDGLHALARLSMFRLENRGIPADTTFKAVHILDKTSLRVCEGRSWDIEAQERIDLSIKDYVEMAGNTTGAMYSCAMKLGALIGNHNDHAINALSMCGENLGIAIHIRQDLNLIWGESDFENSPADDVLSKRKLFPIVYALEKADIRTKRLLGEMYFKRLLEPRDLDSIRTILEDMDAQKECESVINSYLKIATDATESINVTMENLDLLTAFAHSTDS